MNEKKKSLMELAFYDHNPIEEEIIQELIKKVETEINNTPTGKLRNLLCDVNIVLQNNYEKNNK